MNLFPQNRNRKIAFILTCSLLLIFIIMQVGSPTISNPVVKGEFHGPKDVKNIFERSCYDCHSYKTRLQWFDKIAPFSIIVAADVNEARKRYNFSVWDSISSSDQEVKLWYMVNMIEAGKMPLSNYTLFHPEARVSHNELLVLKKYVTELSTNNHSHGDTGKIKLPAIKFQERKRRDPNNVPKSLNNISYFEDYKDWDIIATTRRIDNGTMRLVYGNDITVKAIRENKINPWPDGSKIVKVVWNMQPEDNNGNVKPGNFNNIQIMIKDSKKFSDTEGWGFARFNGLDLIPYGNTISFATGCINCHKLVSKNGFVFDIPTLKPNLLK